MRFMILVRATPDSEAGQMPDDSLLAAMATYHEALAKAGVLLDANGLQPTSKGWRVRYDGGGERRLIDGPFAETKELIAGYTMIQVRSRDEAIAWASRCPASENEVIEIRQVQELEDFPPDVQAAASGLKDLQPQAPAS